MKNAGKALNIGAKRVYDVVPSEIFAEFMKSGWAQTPSTEITQDEVEHHCLRCRAEIVTNSKNPGHRHIINWAIRGCFVDNAFAQGSSVFV